MVKTLLPKGIEKRLKTQAETWERLSHRSDRLKEKTKPAPFITISRQFGCAAYVMAERLVEVLNDRFPGSDFTVYDQKILEITSADKRMSANLIESLSRHRRSMLEDWVEEIFADKPTEFQVFRHLTRTLCAIASLGQAIIVGRGGAVITRNISTGIHVRLFAPQAWRIENLRHNLDRASQANVETVTLADKEREEFVRRYLGTDISNPQLYHLLLNNQLLSTEEQVEAIARLAEVRSQAA